MSNISSKYFSILSNAPPASWVAHITRDFLTCYSYSNFSSIVLWRWRVEGQKGTTDTKFINGTLQIHVLNCNTWNGVVSIDFYKFASDESPFHTQWNPIESGTMQCGLDLKFIIANHCGQLQVRYKKDESVDWLSFNTCKLVPWEVFLFCRIGLR